MITPEDLKLCDEAIKDFNKKNRRAPTDGSISFRVPTPTADAGSIHFETIPLVSNRQLPLETLDFAQDTYMDALIYGTGAIEVPGAPPLWTLPITPQAQRSTSLVNHIEPIVQLLNENLNTIQDDNHQRHLEAAQGYLTQYVGNFPAPFQVLAGMAVPAEPIRPRTTSYRELQLESFYNNVRIVLSQEQLSDAILNPYLEDLQDDRVIKILVSNANHDDLAIIITRDHNDHDKTYRFPVAVFRQLANSAYLPHWPTLSNLLVA